MSRYTPGREQRCHFCFVASVRRKLCIRCGSIPRGGFRGAGDWLCRGKRAAAAAAAVIIDAAVIAAATAAATVAAACVVAG